MDQTVDHDEFSLSYIVEEAINIRVMNHMCKILKANSQNELDLIAENLTREILNTLKPELIMSGDDHDDCEFIYLN
jgi:hypothetical protein